MPEKKQRSLIPRDDGGGVFKELALRIKLILRLMGDPRVNILFKLIPIGSLIYLFFPDLIPITIVDDAAVIWLGFYLFVELCPEEIVQEHMRALTSVVDGEWREIDDSTEGELKQDR